MENLNPGVKVVFGELRLGPGEGFVEGGTEPFSRVMSVMAPVSGGKTLNNKV